VLRTIEVWIDKGKACLLTCQSCFGKMATVVEVKI